MCSVLSGASSQDSNTHLTGIPFPHSFPCKSSHLLLFSAPLDLPSLLPHPLLACSPVLSCSHSLHPFLFILVFNLGPHLSIPCTLSLPRSSLFYHQPTVKESLGQSSGHQLFISVFMEDSHALSLGPSCSHSLTPPPPSLSHPFAIKGPSGHRLFISAFLDGFCALPPYSYPSYLPGSLSQVLSLPSLPGLYHLLPRDHLTPSLPMPQTLLLALLIPTSITSFCHQGIIRSPLIYFSILGQLLCSPLSPSSSLWLDLLGCSPFPHSQASITSSCRHGIIWSPTIYFSVYDGSCVLPPSLMLPICFLPLCTPLFHSRSCSHSLARPLLLVLFCSSQLLSLYASLWTRVLVLYYCSRDFSDNA